MAVMPVAEKDRQRTGSVERRKTAWLLLLGRVDRQRQQPLARCG
jgi:hypothetical protein